MQASLDSLQSSLIWPALPGHHKSLKYVLEVHITTVRSPNGSQICSNYSWPISLVHASTSRSVKHMDAILLESEVVQEGAFYTIF